ncbi:HPC2-domain-containing protein [Hypoxylon sp. FL1284]|nr:HPC2-domain-containing protein [Hypoxylon sp. FL1284]
MLSVPGSPPANHKTKNGAELDEIIVDPTTIRYDGSGQPMLTKDGLPRRKPGPKPGTRINKRSSTNPEEGGDKAKRIRKAKDPNAPPPKSRRKVTSLDGEASEPRSRAASVSGGAGAAAASLRQPKMPEMATMRQGRVETTPHKEVKREGMGSMSSILNADPEPPQHYSHQQSQPSRPSIPSRTSGTNYDPIRSSNYDPIRESMVTHSYSNTMGSPRGPSTAGIVNRASASPSIASLVDPPVPNIISPVPSHTSFAQTAQQSHAHSQSQQRAHKEPNPMPESPNPFRQEFVPPPAPKPPTATETKEAKKATPSVTAATMSKIEIRPTSITTIGAGRPRQTSSKHHAADQSSPRVHATKDGLVPLSGAAERSILDFGKAEPGSEFVAPSIILNIPLNGETNKYINFMRMAEEQYGWDALHPRQAELKARKARIAAASAALAQNDSSREGDEMSVDESDNEDSNVEMGGTSGPEKPADGKPAKKKRHFKEDEYDKDDDFVDDSEMLWEEQAAASRDGFFVYSGPLVPEVEKPEGGRGDGLPKRGRGSRGGRGGGRGAASGTGRGRGGGPGSRGGVVRKPRMTKADKAQMDREKAEREAAFLKQTNGGGSYNVLHPGSPQFAGL